jgi:hypothetical protein
MRHSVGVCFVEEAQCTSEQEFLQLVKRFMEIEWNGCSWWERSGSAVFSER